MSLSKIKSSFYNKFCTILAVFVLLTPNFAFSLTCMNLFKTHENIESILSLENFNEIQHYSIQHISNLANKFIQAKTTEEKRFFKQLLEDSWNAIKSWHKLWNFDVALTQKIINHFEQQLQDRLRETPLSAERLIKANDHKPFLSPLNFHYQLLYVLDSINRAQMEFKENSNEQ